MTTYRFYVRTPDGAFREETEREYLGAIREDLARRADQQLLDALIAANTASLREGPLTMARLRESMDALSQQLGVMNRNIAASQNIFQRVVRLPWDGSLTQSAYDTDSPIYDGPENNPRDEPPMVFGTVTNLSPVDSGEPTYADQDAEISQGMTIDEFQSWTDSLIREVKENP